jgi:transcription antitermination factor NusG
VPVPAVAVEVPRWYAIHTRARHEKKVTTQLQDKGVTTFLPLITQTNRWSDRNKTIQLALFSCCTFVRLEGSPEKRLAILQTPGVVGFVGIHGAGIPIPDKEIENIQTLLAHNVACALYPFLKVGQRVEFVGDVWMGSRAFL